MYRICSGVPLLVALEMAHTACTATSQSTENVDDSWEDAGLDHGLDLRRVASGDVGEHPARLLPDAPLGTVEERGEDA
jgi:hypothetical protein